MANESKDKINNQALTVLIVVLTISILFIGFMIYNSTYGNPYWVNQRNYEKNVQKILSDAKLKNQEESLNATESTVSSVVSEEEIQNEIEEKRMIFSNQIIANMQGICEEAYFDKNGAFIVVVNADWHSFNDGEKDDILFLIENDLRDAKADLEVDGFGQVFSTSGKGLETFYGN